MLLEIPGAFLAFDPHAPVLGIWPHAAARVNPRNNGGDHPGHSKSARLLTLATCAILCIHATGAESHAGSPKLDTKPCLRAETAGGIGYGPVG